MENSAKMAKKKENQKKEKAAPADSPSELREKIWSVISFDKCEASRLSYAEAEAKIAELEAQKVSGLCIVPDEVAARLTKSVSN